MSVAKEERNKVLAFGFVVSADCYSVVSSTTKTENDFGCCDQDAFNGCRDQDKRKDDRDLVPNLDPPWNDTLPPSLRSKLHYTS